jgi:hypothetical protein
MAEDRFDERGRYEGPGNEISIFPWGSLEIGIEIGVGISFIHLVTGGAFQNQYIDDILRS